MNQISTTKRAYASPSITLISIDNEISLSMESMVDPPGAPEEGFAILIKPDCFSNNPFKSDFT